MENSNMEASSKRTLTCSTKYVRLYPRSLAKETEHKWAGASWSIVPCINEIVFMNPRLGGWKGYQSLKPPGPIDMINGLKRFEQIFQGFQINIRQSWSIWYQYQLNTWQIHWMHCKLIAIFYDLRSIALESAQPDCEDHLRAVPSQAKCHFFEGPKEHLQQSLASVWHNIALFQFYGWFYKTHIINVLYC